MNKGTTTFRELIVRQKAHRIVLTVYRISASFPREEKYALVSQMRRSAVSVPANIAEGYRRRSKKEKVHFYNIAQGSLEELRYYLILATDLGYAIGSDNFDVEIDGVSKMLHALIAATSRSQGPNFPNNVP